jgi:ABC-2 type transport system ATP-binding protein
VLKLTPAAAVGCGEKTLRVTKPIVETRNLTKRYGPLAALDDCSMAVDRGEVFGLLGPNGAGKTTLIRLLLGYLKPTSGQAWIDGHDCLSHSVAARRVTAYLPGDASLFANMSGRDVLQFFAEVRPGGDVQRSRHLAERLELDLTRRVSYMSTGMRQKLALAATLAAQTDLLILDEPTSNLDPNVRSEVIALVLEAKHAGRTVMFSSHVMSEVEEACDRVVILRKGRLVHTQKMSELKQQHRIRARLLGDWSPPPADLSEVVQIQHGHNGELTVATSGSLAPLLSWLATLPLDDLRIEPLGLRAVYDRFHGNGTSTPAVEHSHA